MTETVTRHRGGGRDENGKLVADTPTPLTPIGIAPGGGTESPERGRNGEDITAVVYFPPGTDLVSADELTVRGERFRIIVNNWLLAGRGGLEVLCFRGQG